MGLILASASPRRRELLRLLAPAFAVRQTEIDETLTGLGRPDEAVLELARRKAKSVATLHPIDTVIGADTVVSIEGEILGKPKDAADAARMLGLLEGRSHTVFTGICVLCRARGLERTALSSTQVRFAPMSPDEIRAYVASGEPLDKAGAYGIQGIGARFIEGIEGDYYTVMGLPVCGLYRILREIGSLSLPDL